MIEIAALKTQLCNAFCDGFRITPVPDGLSIAAPFLDNSGDAITFYMLEEAGGFRFADDGDYLPRLFASGIDITSGTRRRLLDAILQEADAHLDEESLEVRSDLFSLSNGKDAVPQSIKFLSSLIRLRDIALLTRETVESTFRDDVAAEIVRQIGAHANLNFNEAVYPEFGEFPSDIVIRPNEGNAIPVALYLATSNERLSEALLLHQAAELKKREDFAVVAIVEHPGQNVISPKKFQRAQNRLAAIPIFRGDEDQAVCRIKRAMGLDV